MNVYFKSWSGLCSQLLIPFLWIFWITFRKSDGFFVYKDKFCGYLYFCTVNKNVFLDGMTLSSPGILEGIFCY